MTLEELVIRRFSERIGAPVTQETQLSEILSHFDALWVIGQLEEEVNVDVWDC